MPRCLAKLYKYSFVYLRELLVDFGRLNQREKKKLQHFCVSLYVKIMVSLWLIRVSSRGAPKLFWILTEFLKIYSIPNPHRNQREKFCQPDYFEENENNQTLPFIDLIFLFFSWTSFSLWCFPRFLKMLYSFSNSLSELENCSGNCRVFSLIDIPLLGIS